MTTPADRSLSRGRDVYQSSGRGGAGNIRQASASREPRPTDGPDDFSTSRGREPIPSVLKQSFSTGRGGAGNIRSPSRDKLTPTSTATLVEPTIAEDDVIRVHLAAATESPYSSGRGGAGNIASPHSPSPARRSLSRGGGLEARSLSRGPVHSTGRGGAGNIVSGTYVADEEERVRGRAPVEPKVHSTGRGGAANITTSPDPPVERHAHVHLPGEYESSGRGGSGNIVKDGART